jgi:hypothetical protein
LAVIQNVLHALERIQFCQIFVPVRHYYCAVRMQHFNIQINITLQCLRPCATSRKVAGRFPMVSLEFFIDIILSVALWPWDRLSL